eukprot:10149830-Lingulodinium_polyedra.AAC.1
MPAQCLFNACAMLVDACNACSMLVQCSCSMLFWKLCAMRLECVADDLPMMLPMPVPMISMLCTGVA